MRRRCLLLPWLRLCFVLALAFGTLHFPAPASAGAAGDVGYRSLSFGPNTSSPTAEKPQSKLWFNDGRWWGSLFNRATEAFNIYRFDWATNTWSDTGTVIDSRNAARMDTLWDGAYLYVVSAGRSSTTSGDSPRLLRYSYDFATKGYSLDAGFPVTLASGGTEAIVFDKDSTGTLWATYTRAGQVYVAHSTTDDRTWVTPYPLPVAGASNLLSGIDGDLSALVAFSGQIGVMWSNQNDNTMYFAHHVDGTSDNKWVVNPAVQGPKYADDHMNLKSLQADASGRVFASVKTSLTAASAPLILLLVLDQYGSWQRHTAWQVQDNDPTRPVVLIDETSRNLYVFVASPCCSGGAIYYKQTSLDKIAFPTGFGTPFIQNGTDLKINNPTSTKQNLNSTTGLLVVASDNGSDFYVHNVINLGGGDASAPETTIDSGPSGTVSSDAASFAFSATEAGSTFQCKLDGGVWAACASPQSYSGLAEGGHTFQVRATDAAGNSDATPAGRGWTVDTTAPTAPEIRSPADNSTSTTGAFSVAGKAEASSTVTLFDGGAAQGTTTADGTGDWRMALSDVAAGSHSYTATATDAAGNTSPISNSRTVVVAVIDMSPPTAPRDLTAVAVGSGHVDLSWTAATDDVGVTGYEVYRDGALLATVGNVTSYADASVLPATTYTYSVTARDAAGNVSTASNAATVITPATTDVQAPTAPSGVSATAASSERVDLAWSASSDNVGVTGYEVYRDAALLATVDGGTLGYSDTTVVAQTTYSYTVTARDAAGNRSADSTAATVTTPAPVDATAPDTVIDSGPTGSVASTAATFAFSATEAGSTFQCRLDSADEAGWAACASPQSYSGLADGAHTFEVRATDAAGNTDATPASRSWTVDTTAPTVVSVVPADGATDVAVADSVQVTFSEGIDATTLTTGTFKLVKAGTTTAVDAAVRYDAATKTATLDPTANRDPAASYTATVVGGAGGVTDLAGNPLAADMVWSFTTAASADTTPPSATLTAPANGALVRGSVTLAAEATDDVAVDHVEFLVNGQVVGTDATVPYSIGWNSTSIPDGAATITARATDTSGNTALSATTSVTVDNTAPAAPGLSSPTDGSTTAVRSVVVAGTAEPGATVTVLDGTAAVGTTPADAGGAWSLTLSNVADGSHTYTATATDAAGNVSSASASVTVMVDATAPDTAIDSGPTGTVASDSATFAFSATEAGSTFQCRLDAGDWAACTSPQSYSGLAEGGHTFQVRATDAAGNTDATPAGRGWTLDATAPTVTLTAPASGATVSGIVQVRASASDNVGVTKVNFYLDGVLLGTSTTAPYEIKWNTRKSTTGTHTLYAEAIDAAGNTTRSISITVTVTR